LPTCQVHGATRCDLLPGPATHPGIAIAVVTHAPKKPSRTSSHPVTTIVRGRRSSIAWLGRAAIVGRSSAAARRSRHPASPPRVPASPAGPAGRHSTSVSTGGHAWLGRLIRKDTMPAGRPRHSPPSPPRLLGGRRRRRCRPGRRPPVSRRPARRSLVLQEARLLPGRAAGAHPGHLPRLPAAAWRGSLA